MSLEFVALALSIGATAGFLAGLLGLGGGIVIVPALVFFLPGFTQISWSMPDIVHVALCSMLLSTSSAVWQHHKRGSVLWPWVWRLIPAAWLGSASIQMGALPHVSGTLHQQLFGGFLLLVAIRMLWPESSTTHPPHKSASWQLVPVGVGAGALASLFGLGGAVLMIPWLHRQGLKGHQVSGTTVAGTFGTALFALFVALMIHKGPLDVWPQKLLLAALVGGAGACAAPWGVSWANRLPVQYLKRIFAVFVLCAAQPLLWAA